MRQEFMSCMEGSRAPAANAEKLCLNTMVVQKDEQVFSCGS